MKVNGMIALKNHRQAENNYPTKTSFCGTVGKKLKIRKCLLISQHNTSLYEYDIPFQCYKSVDTEDMNTPENFPSLSVF